MVGVDPFDPVAAASGLPPVDGLNVWPLISGQNATSPRVEIPVSNFTYINGSYKLIVGIKATYAGWEGPVYPNSTTPIHQVQTVTLDCTHGCLFNVEDDPTEHANLAASHPHILASMKARFAVLRESYYQNNEQGVNSCPPDITTECACWMAVNRYGNFFGPYQEV
jgi:arylsulfatase I/J